MTTARNEWPDDAHSFLRKIWRRHEVIGYCFLATRDRLSNRWNEIPILRPETRGLIETLRTFNRNRCDIYFCPNIFRNPRRLRAFALPTPFGWSDIDRGNWQSCAPLPNIVIKTSPGRFQALWFWNHPEEPDQAEYYSNRLTDMAEGDRNGWSITKYLRLPGSFNLKPEYARPRVRINFENWKPQEERPTRGSTRYLRRSLAEVIAPAAIFTANKSGILSRYVRRLHPRTRTLLRDKKVYEPDRSKCVFEIVIGLHEAGATAQEIMILLADNVYFRDKYGNSPTAPRREVARILAKIESRP